MRNSLSGSGTVNQILTTQKLCCSADRLHWQDQTLTRTLLGMGSELLNPRSAPPSRNLIYRLINQSTAKDLLTDRQRERETLCLTDRQTVTGRKTDSQQTRRWSRSRLCRRHPILVVLQVGRRNRLSSGYAKLEVVLSSRRRDS